MKIQVNSKTEFLKGYLALEFGNRLNQWSADEFVRLYTLGKITHQRMGIRRKDGIGKRKAVWMTPQQIFYMFRNDPASTSQFYVDDGAPNEHQLILGEVCQTPQGLHFWGGFGSWHMRQLWRANAEAVRFPLAGDAYPSGRPPQPYVVEYTGLQAYMLLKQHMDPPSWDNLQRLFDEYDDPIIELACFNRSVGVMGWNTIFWEVRTGY